MNWKQYLLLAVVLFVIFLYAWATITDSKQTPVHRVDNVAQEGESLHTTSTSKVIESNNELKITNTLDSGYKILTEVETYKKPILLKEIITQTNEGKHQTFLVEYKKEETHVPVVLTSFSERIEATHEEEVPFTYSIDYLSQKYLVVSQCSNYAPAPCKDYLFDLENLEMIKLSPGYMFGTIHFFEVEKYVVSEGIGRIANIGLTLEILDGDPVHCAISNGDVSDVTYDNRKLIFDEYLIIRKDEYEEKYPDYEIVQDGPDSYEIRKTIEVVVEEVCS